MPSTASSAFSSATSVEQLALASSSAGQRAGRATRSRPRCDALCFEPDVDVRGGIVADEHRRQADRPPGSAAHLRGHLGADPRRQRLPVHQRRRHGRENKLCRCVWPRKNDAGVDQRAARSDPRRRRRRAARTRRRGLDRAQESHTGAACIPGLGRRAARRRARAPYELEEPEGTLRETGRARRRSSLPLAHTEGGLSASMSRGMKAAATSGGFRTYVLQRQNDACILLCLQEHRGCRASCKVAGGVARRPPRLPRCARRPVALEAGEAARGEDARRRADVPRPLGLDDRATRAGRT